MTSRAIALGLGLTASLVIVRAQDQAKTDPPKPVVLALAKPMTPVEAAARLSGKWKLNEELTPAVAASSSPLDGAGQGAPIGRRAGGRPQAYEALRLQEERNIRVRAMYRELVEAPETLTLVVSFAKASIVDPYGFERIVNINSKKEKLDLGTTIVDSRARWDGTALTIELQGGSDLKVDEIFELSPTGTQMLVTIRAGGASESSSRTLRGRVQRVYDRVSR